MATEVLDLTLVSLERQAARPARAWWKSARLWATLVLLVPAIVHLFPVIYLVSLSLKEGVEVFAYPPRLLPEKWYLGNFVDAASRAPIARFLFNSVVASCGITALQVLTSILCAYALARLEFRGKRIVLAAIVATMMVPGEITIIPNYFTVARLGWLDTYLGLVLPFSATGFGVFLLYQFFRSVPKELEEAALVDGASRLRFLFQVLVPVSSPAILALAVYSFVSAWNQYLWPLVATQSTEMQTAQIALGMFRSENESNSWGIIMAATAMLAAPSVAIFVATQRQFVRGLAAGGLK